MNTDTGLQTLATEGLHLPGMADSSVAELLEWHAAKPGCMPDDDRTVLLWVRWPDGGTDWCAGWHDAGEWRLCESGGLCDGQVTHWASPEGPAQA